MSRVAKLRIAGGLILLFNLWIIGENDIGGIPALLLTVGFVLAYESFVVSPAKDKSQS